MAAERIPSHSPMIDVPQTYSRTAMPFVNYVSTAERSAGASAVETQASPTLHALVTKKQNQYRKQKFRLWPIVSAMKPD